MQRLNFEILIFSFSPNKKVSETILLQRPKVLTNSLNPTRLDSATNSKNYYLYVLNFLQLYFSTETRWYIGTYLLNEQ